MSCSPPTAGSPPCMRAGRPGQPPPAGGGDGRDHGLEPEHHHYSNAPLAANSAGMVRRLSGGGHYNVTNGAWGQMGAPVFYADASTPRYTWGAHCGAISGKQVPIPPGSHEAQGPGANTDHKYIVIDTDAKLVNDIWGGRRRGTRLPI
jgi:hypothetical protein